MANILIVHPSLLPVETHLSRWATNIVSAIGSAPGISLTSLTSPISTSTITSITPSQRVTLYLGHGTDTEMGNPVIYNSSNISLCSSQIVISIACDTAKSLGLDAVTRHGIEAYLGFQGFFTLYSTVSSTFGSVIENNVIDFLLYGATIGNVKNNIEADFKAIREDYRTGTKKSLPNATAIWLMAYTNERNVTVLGNAAAVL
jgi:hypothetical protein